MATETISDETIERTVASGPTIAVETVREQRVQSPGLVTVVPVAVERTVLNPETLVGEPRPMPRRRARR